MDNQQQFYRFKRDELAEVYPSQLKMGDSIALGKRDEPIYGAITIDDIWPILPGAEYVTIVYTLPKGARIDSNAAAYISIDGTANEFPIIEVRQNVRLDKVILIKLPHKTPD